MVRAALITALLCSVLLPSCAEDKIVARTQLMLVADTDISSLDQITFDVREGARTRTSGRISVDSGDAPFTMAVLREEGSLGPLTVSASGFRGTRLLVERSAVVSFVPGKTLVVVLHLVQDCVDAECEAEETCTEQGCLPVTLDADSLSSWDGTAPRLGAAQDASVPAADGGADDLDAGADAEGPLEAGSSEDASNEIWTQCGVRDVDINSDIDNCGRCNRPCRSAPGSNTMPACIDGTCGVACRALWGDCDGNPNNGCENSLAVDSENCGACGMTCSSEEYCWSGTCRPDPD